MNRSPNQIVKAGERGISAEDISINHSRPLLCIISLHLASTAELPPSAPRELNTVAPHRDSSERSQQAGLAAPPRETILARNSLQESSTGLSKRRIVQTMNYSQKTNTALGTGVDPERQLATSGDNLNDQREMKPSPSSSRSGETTARNSDEEVVEIPQRSVDVVQAKREFSQLQRSLSRQSSLNRPKSRNSEKGQPNFDPEKGGDHGEEFDLLEYLVSQVTRLYGRDELTSSIFATFSHTAILVATQSLVSSSKRSAYHGRITRSSELAVSS